MAFGGDAPTPSLLHARESAEDACTLEQPPLPLGCSLVSLGELWMVMNCSGGEAVVPFVFVWSVSNILIYAAFIPGKYKSISCCISSRGRSMCTVNVFIPRGAPGWPGGLQLTGTQGHQTCSGFSRELCQEPREAVAGFSCLLKQQQQQQQHRISPIPAL